MKIVLDTNVRVSSLLQPQFIRMHRASRKFDAAECRDFTLTALFVWRRTGSLKD